MVMIEIEIDAGGECLIKITSTGEDPACKVMEKLMPELGKGIRLKRGEARGEHSHAHVHGHGGGH
jgi:hypothetical protein